VLDIYPTTLLFRIQYLLPIMSPAPLDSESALTIIKRTESMAHNGGDDRGDNTREKSRGDFWHPI
jgi:hypothetical protein